MKYRISRVIIEKLHQCTSVIMSAKNRGPYCLVLMQEPNGDESICAVPSQWISTDGKSCYWPKTCGFSVQERMRNDPKSKVGSDWPSYPCVIRRHDIQNLREGREAEKIYEDLNNTDAENR